MSLLKSTAVVSFFTFLSRISGFVRDMLFARFFGASVWTDAFFVVFKIPNFFRRIFAEGSFSLAFVPVLNDIKTRGNQQELKDFVDHVAGSLLSVLLIVFMLLQIFAPQILSIFEWPQEKPEVFDSAVEMFRFTTFYLPAISLVAFAGGILNSFNRFAIPAATPILLNVSLIVMAVFFRQVFEIEVMSLAIGVMLAGFAQLLFQIPGLVQLGLFPRLKLGFKDSKVKKVMKLMVPTLFGSSVAQINLFFDTLLATFLPLAGSVSFLYYSDRLLEFPLGVFAIAISTVILPSLSRQFASDDARNFEATLQWAVTLGFLVAIPSAFGLIALSDEVIYTLFQYGVFDQQASFFTSLSLMAYMLALPAFVLNKILTPAFFARKDAKTPVKIGVFCMFANMLFNVSFVALLWLNDFVALHVGLALASAASGWLQSLLLYFQLKKQGIIRTQTMQWSLILKMFCSGLLMFGLLYFASGFINVLNQAEWHLRFLYLLTLIALGAICYFVTLLAFRVNPKHLISR